MFIDDKKRGKVGEELFKEFLKSKGVNYADVSEIEAFQNKDVDIIVKGQYVEIKTDYRIESTKRIFVECYKEKDGKVYSGWMEKCEADYIAYIDAVSRETFIIKMNRLRDYINHNGEPFGYNIDTRMKTYGHCVPIKKLEADGVIVSKFYI